MRNHCPRCFTCQWIIMMQTYQYRVLMRDWVDGKEFYFAQTYNAIGVRSAASHASYEYDCYIVEVRKL